MSSRRCHKVNLRRASASLTLTLAALFSTLSVPRSVLARQAEAGLVIVVDDAAGPFYRFVGDELRKYIAKLSGVWPDIVRPDAVAKQPAAVHLILVGGPEANPLVRDAAKASAITFNSLKPEGFVLKSVQVARRPALIIGGNDEAGTLYGAYDWLERQGIVFQLTGDILPDGTRDVTVAGLNVRAETPFPRRGCYFMNDMGNTSIWSLPDYQSFIDQMAKLKLNYLQLYWYSYMPFLSYSFRGELMLIGDVGAADSGYILWQRDMGSYRAEDMQVGKEALARFGKRFMAPNELQGVFDPDQAALTAQNLYREIIRYAKTRKIKVWLGIDADELPPNLARYARRENPLPFEPLFGTYVCPTDPVGRQLNEARIRALVETYPEAEGYFFFLSEGYPKYGHPEDLQLINSMRPQFQGMETLLQQWVPWGWTSVDHAKGSMIGESRIIQQMLEDAKRIAPRATFGIGSIGNGFVLPTLNKLFPENVPITDMESRGVWTPKGIPMEMFGGMGARERTIIPRLEDDGSNLGMQFNVNLFYLDRILQGSLQNGAAGFAGQVYRPRGGEWNAKFLAEGAWNPNLTPDEFYSDYAGRVFGDKARQAMVAAFRTFEENEVYLGGRAQRNFPCCGPPNEIIIAKQYSDQPDPFDGPNFPEWKKYIASAPRRIDYLVHAVDFLERARAQLEAADGLVAPRAKYELANMRGRTEAYILQLQTITLLLKGHLAVDAAFKIDPRSDHDAFLAKLKEAHRTFQAANQTAWRTGRKWAEFVDYPSDLEVLRRVNVFLITGTELVDGFMQNIVNFHEGKPYLAPVPWDRVFSPLPEPTSE